MERNHICKKCGGIAGWDSYYQSWICTRCGDVERKPITNYDRLIRKTPEEMAKYIAAEQISGVRTFLNGFDQELEEEFANEVNEHWYEIVREKLDWLRHEAKE